MDTEISFVFPFFPLFYTHKQQQLLVKQASFNKTKYFSKELENTCLLFIKVSLSESWYKRRKKRHKKVGNLVFHRDEKKQEGDELEASNFKG